MHRCFGTEIDFAAERIAKLPEEKLQRKRNFVLDAGLRWFFSTVGRRTLRAGRTIEYARPLRRPSSATLLRSFEQNWARAAEDFYVAIGRNPAQVSTGLTNSGKAGRRSSLSWKDRDCDWGRILPQEPPRDLGRIEGSNHSSYELRRNGRHMKRPQLGLWRSSTSGTPGITPEVWLAAHPERGRFFGGFQPIC